KPEFDSIFQVDVPRKNNSVSSLSLRERAGVRAGFRSENTHSPTPQKKCPLFSGHFVQPITGP
ncbi:hypothetical protein, partial [Pseudomonas sp. GW456-12-1-14-TSB6]|uniref:hypothetical protein n=1 Tax=Pseudomonas sp. GW456-12-1-14-TSB6 TaxID=2751350 RepID=UPI001A91D998